MWRARGEAGPLSLTTTVPRRTDWMPNIGSGTLPLTAPSGSNLPAKAGGNETAEVVTVVDRHLPGFGGVVDAFTNWEDVWATQ